MQKIHLILLYICLLIPYTGYAQISQGGDPLPARLLRSASADFYTEMESFDVQQMLKEDSVQGLRKSATRFAKKFTTDLRPDNSGIHFTLSDGTKVWQCGIRSKGAYSINLLFTRYYVPQGAKLFIYNSGRTSKIGAFTEQNNNEYLKLPTAPVYGDEIVVEYQEPANAAFSGQLTIGEVNHDYRGVTLRSRAGALNSTQTCHKDAACYPEYSEIAQATTLLIINGNEYCTGCLVNNTEQDGTPYLISAAHCFLPKNGATPETRAQNTVIFFNYQDPSCSNVIIGSEEYSMASAELLANETSTDIALLRLTQTPPEYYRPYYAGWNADNPASPPYLCLHHPMSKTKKVAIEDHNLSLVTFTSNDLDYTIQSNIHWKVPSWEVGVTEGGSSGSPLFDSNNRFIGALTGGASFCDSPVNDYFYALQKVWSYYPEPNRQLKYWLDPKNRGILRMNGYNPYPANSCDRLSHIGTNENIGVSYAVSPERGPVFSKNTLHTEECAERYITKKRTTVYGVHLVLPAWKSTMNGQLQISLYKGYIEPYSQPLVTKTVQLSYLNYNGSGFTGVNKPSTAACDNFIRFDNPVEVDYSFFVSYKVNYSSTDTFKIYNALNRSLQFNSAFVNYGTKGWTAMNDFSNNPLYTSLWMDPVVHLGADAVMDSINNSDSTVVSAIHNHEKRYISFKGLTDGQVYFMKLYDITGKLVTQNSDIDLLTTIDTSNFPNGVYVICIWNDKRILNKKIAIY